MKIYFHRNFNKQYKRLNKKQQNKIHERLSLFLKNPFDSVLNNHFLKGKYLNYRSINISGDLRAIYKYLSPNECVFVALGKHSDLYS